MKFNFKKKGNNEIIYSAIKVLDFNDKHIYIVAWHDEDVYMSSLHSIPEVEEKLENGEWVKIMNASQLTYDAKTKAYEDFIEWAGEMRHDNTHTLSEFIEVSEANDWKYDEDGDLI